MPAIVLMTSMDPLSLGALDVDAVLAKPIDIDLFDQVLRDVRSLRATRAAHNG